MMKILSTRLFIGILLISSTITLSVNGNSLGLGQIFGMIFLFEFFSI